MTATCAITPNMLRVTLGGEGLASFPPGAEGSYIKLMFDPAPGSQKPVLRTYTIRNQRADELDIDFALHGVSGTGSGPATDWAMSVKGRETILIGGPGEAKRLPKGGRIGISWQGT